MTNLLALTPEGRIGLKDAAGEGERWLQLWTHVLEAFALRFGPYPAGFAKEISATLQLPKTTFPAVPPGYKALSRLDLKPGGILLKFGKREHLLPALERGALRLTPASSYNDPSLNAAVRDDELSFETITPPAMFTLEVLDPTGGRPIPVRPASPLRVRHTLSTNYYVFCLSTAADHRLFGDFEADACLVLRSPREFLTRLVNAAKAGLPGWRSGGGPVEYLDPLATRNGALHIPLVKHFRYTYQWEYRVYWLPDAPQAKINPVFVELGALDDIGELVVL
ncbi:MAG TPA: hypothetical protein VEN78_14595 [Bradyrhizobium sp.]|nr:hypothetical protein [Bradyrhizobium sp.]